MVDFLETSATDLIRPFSDRPDITVRRRWYRVPEDTPPLGVPSAFLSLHYRAQPWAAEGAGAVFPMQETYARRGTPDGLTFDHVCGTAADFAYGVPFNPTVHVVYDDEWIPECCGRDDVCVTQVCLQYQVNDRPAAETVSYPVPHQSAAPTTPYMLNQVALNQGDSDPAWPGFMQAYFPGGAVLPAGWSLVGVADDNGVMQYVEETLRFDDDNAITQRQDASGWNVVVEQGGVSGSMTLAVVDGVLTLGGTNFAVDEDLLPAGIPTTGGTNTFTANQIIGPTVSTTNTIQTVLTLQQESTGTVANQFGGAILFALESAAGVVRNAARITAQWRIAADATREGQLLFETDGPSFRLTNLILSNDGSAPTVGFYGGGPQPRFTALASTFGVTVGTGATLTDDTTFTGDLGSTAYTLTDIVTALKKLNLIQP